MAYSVPESGSLTAEESKNLIQSLKGEYGISMEEIDRATLMKSGFQEVTGDQLARLSGVLQQAPGLLANRAIQKNYEGAVRLVVPPDMPEGAHAMAAKKLGTDVFYGEYVNDKNRIAGKAGYQNIDATAANAAQLANAVFAAASVATQQHYLHNIDKKLKALKSSTADILQFLELDKRTELQAQQAFLTEIFENLEAINLCEDQRRATITSVQTIRQKAMSAMVFYQERTRQRTQTRPSDAGKTEIKENIRKITADIAPYWLSIHTYGMAYILEILLTKNFNSRYLKNIARILREQQQKYDACYTECAEEISRYVQKLAPEKDMLWLMRWHPAEFREYGPLR